MLYLGLLASAWATFGGLWGAINSKRRIEVSAERGVLVATVTSLVAGLALVRLLLARDYSVAYVWEYTSNTLEDIYAATALWAGQEGSLLLWLMVLGVMGSIAIMRNRKLHPELVPHVTWVIASIQLFFFILLCFVADPFTLLVTKFPQALGQTVLDGNGLNPMLQNFGMIIHPPLLYLGYIGFSIPFAFAIAALMANRLTPDWITTTRFWTITSWAILGMGIITGAKWAYVELGWGGYWAWDPVENASLMPWLTGTAFLHSVMIEERRGMLRRWNIFLVILTFLLSIFGTFLTRSGVLQSVHSFAQSKVGDVFLYFMIGWAIIAGGLFMRRWNDLKPRQSIESLFSREAFFLLQNLVLLGICGAVMWGTMYPIISEALTGDKVTVSAPYFNRVILPLGLALFLLTGAGPMISWRRASVDSLKRNLGLPLLAGLVAGGLAYAAGYADLMAVQAFALAIFIISAITMDIFICGRARQKQTGEGFFRSAFLLMDRNRRRYAGFFVHLGMAILLVGLAGNAFSTQVEKHMKPGETMSLGAYTVRYNGFTSEEDAHRVALKADLTVFVGNREVGKEIPEISIYFPGTEREQRASEVAIRSRPLEDLYLIFVEPAEQGGNATIRMMVHPFVSFVWNGALMAVIGGFLALAPWSLPFAWAQARRAASAVALGFVLLASASGPAWAYSETMGDRDPVSRQFICQCGCGQLLEKCDHAQCGSRHELLGELAELRATGLDEAGMVDAMVKKHGMQILAEPPKTGVHMMAWIMPFAGIGVALIVLIAWLSRRRATSGASGADAGSTADAEPAGLLPDEMAKVEAALKAHRHEDSL